MKYLIVEGKTDKKRLEELLDEPVTIICTYGTLSEEKIEELILPLEEEEVYILVDADEAGNKLRKQLKRELPNAKHLYTRKVYREVARTPIEHLVKILSDANFETKIFM
ncbi:toprim domain-containing protein [Caldalkalibacillus mannanilyticus]|uniref:toprim domain-containing protein n=1 Tax=Caldalkalibacillus mannanilyticus TaxID=1418 RepID=UPI0004685837|nr:toprim domain-containing protein [Caldalkalibacillus mannanilyticus]